MSQIDPGIDRQSFYDFCVALDDGLFSLYADELYKLGVSSHSFSSPNIIESLIAGGLPPIPAADIVSAFREKFHKSTIGIFHDYENVSFLDMLKRMPNELNATSADCVERIVSRLGIYGSVAAFNIYAPEKVIREHLMEDLGNSAVNLLPVEHHHRVEVADKMILVDAISFAFEQVDPLVVIISNDSDFSHLISRFTMMGVRTICISSEDKHVRSVRSVATLNLMFPSDFLPSAKSMKHAIARKKQQQQQKIEQSLQKLEGNRNKEVGGTTTTTTKSTNENNNQEEQEDDGNNIIDNKNVFTTTSSAASHPQQYQRNNHPPVPWSSNFAPSQQPPQRFSYQATPTTDISDPHHSSNLIRRSSYSNSGASSSAVRTLHMPRVSSFGPSRNISDFPTSVLQRHGSDHSSSTSSEIQHPHAQHTTYKIPGSRISITKNSSSSNFSPATFSGLSDKDFVDLDAVESLVLIVKALAKNNHNNNNADVDDNHVKRSAVGAEVKRNIGAVNFSTLVTTAVEKNLVMVGGELGTAWIAPVEEKKK